MVKNKKAPEIRFKGFTEDWEQRKLGDIGFFRSNGVDKKINENEIEVNLLNYMDVYNSKKINNKNTNTLMRVTAKSNQIGECNIEKNDVFFTPTSETADDIGHVLVIEESLENTVYSYHLMRYRPQVGEFFSTYPNYGFATKELREQMRVAAKGVQRFVISKPDFEQFEIKRPCFEEQRKIAIFMTDLDNLITLHQRKYEKLVNVKKSMLEKMFPKNSSKVPEIRFKGFTEDWEQRKLGDLLIDTIDNRGKNPPYYCECGIPVIDNFMIKNNGYPELKIATRYLDDYLYNNFVRKYNEKDDVLITLVGNGIGNVALFPKEKSVIIQNTLGLRFENPKIFKYYSMLSKNNQIIKLDRGMAQPSIRQDELKEIDIEIPDEKEQFKISNFMFNIDNLITLHQRKLEKLNNIKKSMLDKMFV